MEISYKREMKHNYLVIEGEEGAHSYELRMMADNAIEGLMKFRVKRVDSQCCYCYEITSRQPLSRLLENHCLKAEEVRILILGLAKTLGKLEEYLLNEEQILLQPDYIYVEPELFSVEFCLIPGRTGDFPAELGKLLEYLLGKVDYQDKACVVMTYGMYRESLKENYGIDDLLKFLTTADSRESYEVEEEDDLNMVKPAKLDKPTSLAKPTKPVSPAKLDKPTRPVKPTKPTEWPEPPAHSDQKLRKQSWKERLRQFLDQIRGETSEKILPSPPEPQETTLPWQMVFAEDPPYHPDQNDTKGNQRSRDYVEPEGPNTVLLYEKEEKQLRKLISLEAGVPDIVIAYYPFIIGKQENLVDYVMNQDTVSRLHLRIDENDGIYRITDLNSTNGTGVAGRILENNESAEVAVGDEVTVAGLRFKFG